MPQAPKQIKERYFKKVYDAALIVACACGCGREMKNRDRFGRTKTYITGHNGRKYTDPQQHKREWNHRNQESRYQLKIQRGRDLKRRLIQYKGAHCHECERPYDGTNGCAFHFHHRDPTDKDVAICQRTLTTYAWARLQREADKCNLVCAYCHALIHGEPF